jgi:hypothetical protein
MDTSPGGDCAAFFIVKNSAEAVIQLIASRL